MSFNYLDVLEILQEFLLNSVKLMACQSNSIECHRNADGKKKIVAFSLLCLLLLLEKEHLLRGTRKQGKLALASHLYPHIGLNAEEECGINLTALLQREANTILNKRQGARPAQSSHTARLIGDIQFNRPVRRAQVSRTKYITRG